MHNVQFTAAAEENLVRLDKAMAQRVLRRIRWLAENFTAITPGINLTYVQLIAAFPPRPIASDEQYWETQARIDELLDKGALTPDEADYLTALGMMIERYEEEHEPDIESHGVALIRALIDEQGLRQRDLVASVFKTDSIASAILNGKRRLTTAHIDRLAHFFQLPHGLFFEPLSDDLDFSPLQTGEQSAELPVEQDHLLAQIN